MIPARAPSGWADNAATRKTSPWSYSGRPVATLSTGVTATEGWHPRQNYPPGKAWPAPDGSLYIADSYWHEVRHITPEGFIQPVAGEPLVGRQQVKKWPNRGRESFATLPAAQNWKVR